MLEFIVTTLVQLDVAPPDKWAELWVNRKLEFCRRFGWNRVCSIVHGADFFDNLLNCALGRTKWPEQGEYGNNFRSLVKQAREEALINT